MSRRSEVVQQLQDNRVSAILRTGEATAAADAMAAAIAGGFRTVEFTLNTPGAFALIRRFSGEANLLVGAGTVLTTQQVDAAVEAGARFIVSPVTDSAVLARAGQLDVASVPGAATPTEMMRAVAAGADVVKLFPAPADIAAYVRQIRGPLPQLRVFPTAGVTPENFLEILAAGAFGVGFVGPLFPAHDLQNRDFAGIEARARGILARLEKSPPTPGPGAV